MRLDMSSFRSMKALNKFALHLANSHLPCVGRRNQMGKFLLAMIEGLHPLCNMQNGTKPEGRNCVPRFMNSDLVKGWSGILKAMKEKGWVTKYESRVPHAADKARLTFKHWRRKCRKSRSPETCIPLHPERSIQPKRCRSKWTTSFHLHPLLLLWSAVRNIEDLISINVMHEVLHPFRQGE